MINVISKADKINTLNHGRWILKKEKLTTFGNSIEKGGQAF